MIAIESTNLNNLHPPAKPKGQKRNSWYGAHNPPPDGSLAVWGRSPSGGYCEELGEVSWRTLPPQSVCIDLKTRVIHRHLRAQP